MGVLRRRRRTARGNIHRARCKEAPRRMYAHSVAEPRVRLLMRSEAVGFENPRVIAYSLQHWPVLAASLVPRRRSSSRTNQAAATAQQTMSPPRIQARCVALAPPAVRRVAQPAAHIEHFGTASARSPDRSDVAAARVLLIGCITDGVWVAVSVTDPLHVPVQAPLVAPLGDDVE